MDKPNGLRFSPDEKKLYIVDTGVPKHPSDPHPIRIYDVVDGVRPKNGRLVVNMAPGSYDGIRSCGRQHLVRRRMGEGYNGVHVFASDGTLIGKIHRPDLREPLLLRCQEKQVVHGCKPSLCTQSMSIPRAPRCLDQYTFCGICWEGAGDISTGLVRSIGILS
jgi:hypothetical protein